jgi:hypothetical protein
MTLAERNLQEAEVEIALKLAFANLEQVNGFRNPAARQQILSAIITLDPRFAGELELTLSNFPSPYVGTTGYIGPQ